VKKKGGTGEKKGRMPVAAPRNESAQTAEKIPPRRKKEFQERDCNEKDGKRTEEAKNKRRYASLFGQENSQPKNKRPLKKKDKHHSG